MQAIDKAYIAGIIDGEGSIMLTKFHKNQHPSPCISIASTSLELLIWIKDKTGYGDIKSKKNYNIEKQRAELILSEYKSVTPRNGRYSTELLQQKQAFYQKFTSL